MQSQEVTMRKAIHDEMSDAELMATAASADDGEDEPTTVQ
jgi:hypothetical protein